MSELKLDFKAGRFSINRSTGDVILLHEDDRLLHKYTLRQDGSYINQWKRQVPANEDNCKYLAAVYLTDAGDVMLQNRGPYLELSSLTHHFDQDMKLLDSLEYDGELVGCLSGPRAVYVVKKGERHVVIRGLNGEVLQLEPPEGTKWAYSTNVCEDVKTGKLMVCSDSIQSRTIDVFSHEGTSQHIMHSLLMCLPLCKQ